MEDKNLIKKLKLLEEPTESKDFLVSLQNDLKEYMDLYPYKEKVNVKKPSIWLQYGTLKLKFIVLALILIFFFGGRELVFASQKSLPGDILYPIKISLENLQKAFLFDPLEKAELEIRLAEKRLQEIESIIEMEGNKSIKLRVAEKLLNENLINIQQIIPNNFSEGKNVDSEDVNKLIRGLNDINSLIERYQYQTNLNLEIESDTNENQNLKNNLVEVEQKQQEETMLEIKKESLLDSLYVEPQFIEDKARLNSEGSADYNGTYNTNEIKYGGKK